MQRNEQLVFVVDVHVQFDLFWVYPLSVLLFDAVSYVGKLLSYVYQNGVRQKIDKRLRRVDSDNSASEYFFILLQLVEPHVYVYFELRVIKLF